MKTFNLIDIYTNECVKSIACSDKIIKELNYALALNGSSYRWLQQTVSDAQGARGDC